MALEKKYLWVIGAGAALAIGTAAVLVGLPKYKQWQAERLIQSARISSEKGAYVDASLNLRHVLDLFPNHPTAHAMLADMAEKAGDPAAVLWRKRLAELSGGKTDALIAYAAVATRFNQRAAAKDALDRVPAADRERVEYLSAAGGLAFVSREFAQAVALYRKAVRLAPTDPALQFALASAEISTGEYQDRETGRERLRKLEENPEWQVNAARTLIANLSASGEPLAALREARKLNTFAGHEFRDELLLLNLLRATDDPQFRTALTELQEKAEAKMDNTRSLLAWMAESGLSREGLEWVTVKNPELAKAPELQPAIAASYVSSENWPAVLAITQGADWGPLEYVRHVYRSRALRERGELSLAVSDWKIAATAAASRAEAILWLARTAEKWGWPEETEQALWAAVERGADSDWALDTLRVRYVKARDTNGLRRVAAQMTKSDPADLEAMNNFSALSLLLGKELERAMRLAREVYQKQPDNPDFASTYAYSLVRAGDLEGARAIMEKHLSPTKLLEPSYAAYYGIILESLGSADAGRYLEIARKGQLLPEELDFVQAAAARIAPKGAPNVSKSALLQQPNVGDVEANGGKP